MLTLFTIPKPFEGHIGVIQRNAVRSWTLLRPRPEIILLGDETGTADVAQEMGLRHIAEVERNQYGTPLISFVLACGQEAARNRLVCYVNADIILLSSFMNAVEQVSRRFGEAGFLMIGRRWNIDIREPWNFENSTWEERLGEKVTAHGILHPPSGLDYFVFPKGVPGTVPPFAVGRPGWDNWFVFRAREQGFPVIDATPFAKVIHQHHDYSHLAGGEEWQKRSPEAEYNRHLRGGFSRLFTTYDATHVLTSQGLKPSPLWYSIGATYLRARAYSARTLTHTLYPYSYPLLLVIKGLRRIRDLLRV